MVALILRLFSETLAELSLFSPMRTDTQQLKSCIYKFYGCFNIKIIFRNTRRIKSFFPYEDRLSHSLRSKVVYKASCWDCDDSYIRKTSIT